jgi:hypothetical protein
VVAAERRDAGILDVAPTILRAFARQPELDGAYQA